MAVVSTEIWTIGQLTRRIKNLLQEQVGMVWISGEISNWRPANSGHVYFTLKDAESQIDAVMFKGKLSRLRFEPENGLEVLVHGLITVYERRGSYQIVVEEMEPKGVGALQLAFEKLKKKLEAEGVFAQDRKKPLPLLPRRIGIVTSPTGAAIRDILNVLQRRFANIHVLLYPARVQGDGAAAEVAEGIRRLDELGVDVMIVGRGGGSLEDLWCFNEEVVVRAVAAARTPVISAVGHEIDFSLCDFAADVRAPTPSAAAELVVKEQQALLDHVTLIHRRLTKSMRAHVELGRHRLAMARRASVLRRPEELLREQRQELDDLRLRLEDGMRARLREERRQMDRLQRALSLLSPAAQLRQMAQRLLSLRERLARGSRQTVDMRQGAYRPVPARLLRGMRQYTDGRRAELRPLLARLDALSPLKILGRGYALAWKEPEHRLLRNTAELQPGEAVQVRLGAGSFMAAVTSIDNEGKHGKDQG